MTIIVWPGVRVRVRVSHDVCARYRYSTACTRYSNMVTSIVYLCNYTYSQLVFRLTSGEQVVLICSMVNAVIAAAKTMIYALAKQVQ